MTNTCDSCDTTTGTTWHAGYRGYYCPLCTAYINARETALALMGDDSRYDDYGTYAVDMQLDPATVATWAHLVPVGYVDMVR